MRALRRFFMRFFNVMTMCRSDKMPGDERLRSEEHTSELQSQ